MKSRLRHNAGRTAAKFATADLFAPPFALAPELAAPLFAPKPAPTAITPQCGPALRSTPIPLAAPPSAAKQLWYAVVFQELSELHVSPLRRLCLSAQQFTSLVSIEMPNALLLEIKGSVKLFGSLDVLHADIDAAWKRLALNARSAIAPTALAALWLARADKQVRIEDTGLLVSGLAQVPIGCTAWDAEWLRTLRALGVTRLGELLRLPRAGLSRRLSPAAVLDLDIAVARQPAPRRAFVPRERFRERCDFETEIETVVYLQKALEPLIERCAHFLRERQAGIQALELTLRHRLIAATHVRLGLASITSERRRLTDVLDEKLHRLELPAPVRGMELRSGSLLPLSADSLDAFAGLRGGSRDTAPQLVERLRARLGDESVYGLRSVAEHRPEAAWQRVRELRLTDMPGTHLRVSGVRAAHVRKAHVQVSEVPAAAHLPGMPAHDPEMPRPVWLLTEPAPLSAAELQQLQQGGLVLEEGPERIESGWWDGHGVARDYYVARQPQGARWWVFQERRSKSWYLHGVFA